jgi:D-alanyl-D-alanine carboxypeptidase (penicillin-binding protein 5/6)
MSAARLGHPRSHGVTHRARVTAGVAAAGLLAAAVLWWPGQVGWGQAPHRSVLKSLTIKWPSQGQSALAVVGAGHRASGPDMPVPIASIAKVMTAYVVLRGFPLAGDDDGGFTLTFSQADAELAEADKSQGQSYLPVQAGEVMQERSAIEALLLPSANNIAMALAEHVAGGVPAFVNAMNVAARGLGMRHTTYTDPSGLDPTTRSTAADQLRLARAAMRNRTFAHVVGMQRASIPVAGVVGNTDTLLGHDGFVGIKTGSDDAAGGCFMFENRQRFEGKQHTVLGVVLGQRGGPLIHAALDASQRLVDGVMAQLAPMQ